uniref:Uncharacterized protein n=1 Tax=Alexandrium catenella TaxID=2925 RepID=A0A7S1Q0K7_ALECA|mmetsp:Transcript_118383/g.315072  ORF Transcript_118383/g.315072 Transcript_118383/m.315072 type:complete len:213 (+) Transcript_118383:85-723(+)
MPSKVLSVVLALAAGVVAKAEKLAADCSQNTTENCIHSRCCNVPGTKCFRKNKKWAACRETCEPGPHYNEFPYSDEPWDCVELTEGCNGMHKPCGVRKNYLGSPCCQWGCRCNETTWGAACVATKASGQYTCNKHNEETYSSEAGENFDVRKIATLPRAPSTQGLRTAGLVGLAVVAVAAAVGAAVRVQHRRARSGQSLMSEVDEEMKDQAE